jgi:DNA primase
VAEGEMDTIVLSGCGVDAVGIPGANHDHLFKRTWVHMFHGADVVLCLDGDDHGRAAGLRLRDGFASHGIAVTMVDVPDGLDINEWYVEDPDGLRQALDQGGT